MAAEILARVLAVEAAGAVIEARGLVKRFAGVEAVAGIDLSVPRGGVYGFLGPNGAGKTTTIRMLVGLIRPTRGTAFLFGQPVGLSAPVLARVGSLVERPAFYPYLSATDNLRVLANARLIPPAQIPGRIGEVLERVELSGAAKRKAGKFSTGMKQRLGIAAALLDRPELVILDEPTNGLDPNGVVDVRDLIAALARDGTTVFLSSHILSEVEQVCDRVAILRAGRIVAEGDTQAMLQTGERLLVRFDVAEEAARARPILSAMGPVEPAGDRALLVEVPASAGSRVARALADAQLYPAELAVRRPSLESVFLELTADEAATPVAGPPAAPPAPPPASTVQPPA
jgi:ABC-2 type transport system ATP-binding protein